MCLKGFVKLSSPLILNSDGLRQDEKEAKESRHEKKNDGWRGEQMSSEKERERGGEKEKKNQKE